jgi:hypothetical protein
VALVREHLATLTVVHTPPRWPGVDDDPLANLFIADTTHTQVSMLFPPDVRGVTRVVLVRGGHVADTVVDTARCEEADLVLAEPAAARALVAISPCAVLSIPSVRR